MNVVPGAWPPAERAKRPWRQAARGGTREDRELREIEVVLPPLIAERAVALDSTVGAALEAAMREVTALDHTHGGALDALGVLLLRTESVASSKIEQVSASVDDYARALHGVKANDSAVSMVAATTALEQLMTRVDGSDAIDVAMITDAHEALMKEDPTERPYAGRVRDVQNWIGGSDHSPRGALYVPPPPDTLDGYLDDLVDFMNRDDLPALAQAALAHAQFESIHPFTDGNGRIGRALINAVLRRRAATHQVVVPIASALVAHRERYFAVLGAYRDGEIRPLIESFAAAVEIAAAESRVTATNLARIAEEWREAVGSVRAKSAAGALLELLPERPILTADEACELVGGSVSSVYAAIARLHDSGVLRPLTDRKRNQVWGAAAVLDELDDLGLRIAAAVR